MCYDNEIGNELALWLHPLLPFYLKHVDLPINFTLKTFMEHAGIWDSVVTCFFIDTAHNIVEYIEIISKILKEGGVSSQILRIMTFFFSL